MFINNTKVVLMNGYVILCVRFKLKVLSIYLVATTKNQTMGIWVPPSGEEVLDIYYLFRRQYVKRKYTYNDSFIDSRGLISY